MFPKNTWYVACTPDEFAERPLGRKICGGFIYLAPHQKELQKICL